MKMMETKGELNALEKLWDYLTRGINRRIAKRKVLNRVKDYSTIPSTQRKAIEVVFELLKDKENELLIAPLSNKYYLKNDSINMLVTIFSIGERGGFVNIINGKYHYDIFLNRFAYNYMLDRFMKVVDRHRNTMENEIRAKTDKSLETIYQSLKEEHELKKLKENGPTTPSNE